MGLRNSHSQAKACTRCGISLALDPLRTGLLPVRTAHLNHEHGF